MTRSKLIKITPFVALGIYFVALNTKSPWDTWLMFLGFIVFALPFIWPAFQFFNLLWTQRKQQSVDVSLENHPPTTRAAYLIQKASELGFTRLGETRTPVIGRQNTVSWILVSPDHSETAEVVDLPNNTAALIEFSTVFIDHAFLQTSYPYGIHSDHPTLRSRFNTVDLQTAYSQHVNDRAKLEITHGPALPIGSMAEHLRWEAYYRKHHLGKRFRRLAFRPIVISLWFLGFIAFGIYVNVMSNFSDRLGVTDQQSLNCLGGWVCGLSILGILTIIVLVFPSARRT